LKLVNEGPYGGHVSDFCVTYRKCSSLSFLFLVSGTWIFLVGVSDVEPKFEQVDAVSFPSKVT
jgi:hypothetical protein